MKSLLAACWLLLVTACAFNSALLPGRTFLPADQLLLTPPWQQHADSLLPGFQHASRPATDPVYYFYPARKYLSDSLRGGVVPLWNPMASSGTPFAADDQSAVYYPPNWLFAVFPLPMAFGWIAALHTFLAGLFFVMYGRRMGWAWAACLSGATTWMLCGVMVAWQMWQVVDATLCWLPLILYFWEGWQQSGRLPEVVGAGVALGMSALAGHVQFAFYVWMAAVSYAAFRAVANRRQGWRLPAGLAGMALLGLAVASVQLIATVDFLTHTRRSEAGYGQIMSLMMPPSHLILLAAPEILGGQRDYFSHPWLGGYSAFGYWEFTSFCGAAALCFGGYALGWIRTPGQARSRTLFWLGMILFALLMACGSPLYALFYYGLPLFRSFHGPARILVLLDFAVAVLCAEGVQRIIISSLDSAGSITQGPGGPVPGRRRTAGRLLAGMAVALLVGYRFCVTNTTDQAKDYLTHEGFSYGLIRIAIAILAAAAACWVIGRTPVRRSWLAVCVVAAESLMFAVGNNASVPANVLFPPTDDTQFVSSHLQGGRVYCVGDPIRYQTRMIPDTAMALGWNDVVGSDPLILANYAPIERALDRAQDAAPPHGEPGSVTPVQTLLDRLNVRYVISPRPIADVADVLAYSDAVYVYQNPRAFGVAQIRPAIAAQAGGNPPLSPSPSPLQGKGSQRSSKLDEDAAATRPLAVPGPDGEVTLTCHLDQPGFLETSIVFDPGWTASVDGRPAAARATASGAFLSLPLPSGDHRVRLAYRPSSVAVGLYVTCLAWMFIGAVSAIGIARRRRSF